MQETEMIFKLGTVEWALNPLFVSILLKLYSGCPSRQGCECQLTYRRCCQQRRAY